MSCNVFVCLFVCLCVCVCVCANEVCEGILRCSYLAVHDALTPAVVIREAETTRHPVLILPVAVQAGAINDEANFLVVSSDDLLRRSIPG